MEKRKEKEKEKKFFICIKERDGNNWSKVGEEESLNVPISINFL